MREIPSCLPLEFSAGGNVTTWVGGPVHAPLMHFSSSGLLVHQSNDTAVRYGFI